MFKRLITILQVTNDFQNQKKKSEELLRVLKANDFKDVMRNVSSPLDPTLRFRDLKSVISFYVYDHDDDIIIISDDKCKVMDSKMRPLWLVFHNRDMLGESILHIFKNGDGMSYHQLRVAHVPIIFYRPTSRYADSADYRHYGQSVEG